MYFLYSDQVSDNYLLSVVHFSVMPTPCSLILYLVSREPVTYKESVLNLLFLLNVL